MCILTTKRFVPSITEEKTYRLNKCIHEVFLRLVHHSSWSLRHVLFFPAFVYGKLCGKARKN